MTSRTSHGYSAVILNYGQWQATLACLESLYSSSLPPERVVVCDNPSGDDSLRHLAFWAEAQLQAGRISSWRLVSNPANTPASPNDSQAELILIDNGANLGYAGGNNRGLRYLLDLGAEYIWLLNNDTIVLPDAPAALLDYMGENQRCGLCGALTRYMETPDIVQCYGGGWYHEIWGRGGLYGDGDMLPLGQVPLDFAPPLDYVNGASVFLRRAFLVDVGLMEERYFLYCEEIDWARRARGCWALGFAPRATVLHMEGLSTGMSNRRRLGRSFKIMLRLVRSRLLFTLLHCPWFLPTVALGQAVAAIGKICKVALPVRK
ncbi:MAG: glycosyltransferase family 2 protein [Proteobacteria bacterium]|nr:glycosyltransferase family 2 protein [Pseudomonadota bacterium]